MASLMQDLIEVLNQEVVAYKQLLGLSSQKTPVIVSGDLKRLSEITDEEQLIVGDIQKLEKTRVSSMVDIANVLNMDVKTLKLTDLVRMLDKRPSEQQQLARVRDELKSIADHVRLVNSQNQELLQGSLEMVQFEMNILESTGSAPETANYNRSADTSGDVIGVNIGRFDARQ
ncbi:flagellar protein FlgN [Butyrivibrio sp. NC3005]|jgi:flagellar biosynthesis/type III secretory pathway chaperone|uniref:flagellar protein FlgN n=1 Tax=Butyrivibrio sp. NC3005 TaxID=1280685 RepID=UPI00042687CD|nr:flagellar protein FlgN [Butyrivibrio sp. NC3005]